MNLNIKRRKTADNLSEINCKYCNSLDDDHIELITLTNPKLLSLYDDVEQNNANGYVDKEERPQHRISNFLIHDQHNRICSFDCGKIQQGKHIYLCGNVLPICQDENHFGHRNQNYGTGIPTKIIGLSLINY